MIGARALRLLAYTDSPMIGGAELALGYLLGALAPEIEVGVIATEASVAQAVAARRPGALLTTVRRPQGTHDWAALGEHLGAVRGFGADIVHVNQAWPWACAYGATAGLLAGVSVIGVDHLPVGGAMPAVRRLGRRALARRLHAHVAVGDRVARLIEQLVGLPSGSVLSAANGVPPVQPAPVVAHARARASGSPVVVGSLGRLTRQKGYDLLVRAISGLPDVSAVLVGDGPERPALEALASELGVADRVRITGWTAQARGHLDGFEVFALPSRWEGMPLSIIEAMHAGLPVVASDVGSIREVVDDGATGYLTPAEDHLALRDRLSSLLADAELRERMGRRAMARAAERFTDTAMARRYEAIYDAVARAGLSRRRSLLSAGRARPGSSRSAR